MGTDPLGHIPTLPGVADAVLEARGAIDRVYGHRMLRRRGPEISAESALRGAYASAVLAGSGAVLDDVRAGTSTDPLVQGALRATAELGRLTGVWGTAPRQAFARLHALAAHDLVAADELGRPRDARPLDALTHVIAATDVPAVVLGAIVHGEILRAEPFGVADGLVARAAQRLVFIERGLDRKALAMTELGHLESGPSYAEALDAYRTGTPEGVAAWVRHCASAIVVGARETLAVCEALQRG